MNKGGIIAGVLIVGVAIMYMGSASAETPDPVPGCIDVLATNYNPAATVDNGTCEYEPGDSPEEIAEKEEEEAQQEEWSSVCDSLWNSDGTRKESAPKQQGSVQQFGKWHRWSCALNGFKTVVFTDKYEYVAGESITIIIGKTVYSTRGDDNNWHQWGSSQWLHGENMSFSIGITDEYGDSLLDYGKRAGSPLSVNDASALTDGLSDVYPSPGTNSAYDEDYGWVKIVIHTSDLADIAEVQSYFLKYETEIGPYPFISRCGSGDRGNYRTYTASTPSFKIYPKSCGTHQSGSAAETYNSEWSQSHQSFMSEWV